MRGKLDIGHLVCSGRVDMGQRTKSFTQGLSCTRRTPGRAPNPESRVSVWGCVPPPTQGSVHVCQGEPHLGVNLAGWGCIEHGYMSGVSTQLCIRPLRSQDRANGGKRRMNVNHFMLWQSKDSKSSQFKTDLAKVCFSGHKGRIYFNIR